MSNKVDVIGVGNITVPNEPILPMSTLKEYEETAEKIVASRGKGLHHLMRENEDFKACMVYEVMLADWKFNGEGCRYGFRKERLLYAIQNFLTRKAKSKNHFSINSSFSNDGENADFDIPDSSEEPLFEQEEQCSYLVQQIRELVNEGKVSARGWFFLEKHYLQGIPVRKIAESEGIQRQAVYISMSNACKQIKTQLKDKIF